MNTINFASSGYNRSTHSNQQVDPELIRDLESRGFRRPIRDLSDARLRLPELLLMEGWERTTHDDVVSYSRRLPDDSEAGQTLVFYEDRTRVVETMVDGDIQVLKSTPDGKVQETRQ